MTGGTFSRRELLLAAGGAMLAPLLARRLVEAAVPALRVTAIELLPVRATARTVWLFVRLRTDAGLSGLGEASDAFGFANTTPENADSMRAQTQAFFALIEGGSRLEIERFRQRGWSMARNGLVAATAFSAIEQAMWDLAGQALQVPAYVLFGGKVRDTVPIYANINRATTPRTPDGFAAAARRAVRDGFRALKAAPFDGFPAPGSPAAAIDAAVDAGIASAAAMREAAGPRVDIIAANVNYLELQYGEVGWRSEVLTPPERFVEGRLAVPDRPGFGVAVNEAVIRERSMPL